MKAKKAVLISLIFFCLMIVTGMVVMGVSYYNRHAVKTIYYTEDYTELYKEELRIIFGENYRIGEKETITIEGEDCSCGYHADTAIYDQWEISYEDRLGQKYTQTLNNKDTLENQQLRWLEEQLLDALGDKENMIHLWELDYQQIFRDFPMKVSLHLSIDDEKLAGDEKAEFEKAVREKTLQVLEAVKAESSNTCNLNVNICCAQGREKLYDGEGNWNYRLLQGEKVETGGDYKDYDWEVFESYEGVFW